MLSTETLRMRDLPLNRSGLMQDMIGAIRSYGGTLGALSAEAAVHPNTLSAWLDGRTLHPRLDTLTRVAEALGYRIGLAPIEHGAH